MMKRRRRGLAQGHSLKAQRTAGRNCKYPRTSAAYPSHRGSEVGRRGEALHTHGTHETLQQRQRTHHCVTAAEVPHKLLPRRRFGADSLPPAGILAGGLHCSLSTKLSTRYKSCNRHYEFDFVSGHNITVIDFVPGLFRCHIEQPDQTLAEASNFGRSFDADTAPP